MSTNAIGTGTVNFPINMPREERMIYGRLATSANQSIGNFLRKLFISGLEAELRAMEAEAGEGFIHVTAANRIIALRSEIETLKRIRREYYGAVAVVVCLAAFFIGLNDHSDLRQARRRGQERIEEVREG